jgi:hypothetical protein
MDVDIMNIMKYDTNKRWVIHNFSKQQMGNSQLPKSFPLNKSNS